MPEHGRVEKIFNGNRKTVTQLLQRRDGHAAVAPADNIVDRRLRDPAEGAQPVDGKMSFLT